MYFRTQYLQIQVAALRSSLLLFESCIKMNTTIGGLSEEILFFRNFIVNYILRNQITDEKYMSFILNIKYHLLH